MDDVKRVAEAVMGQRDGVRPVWDWLSKRIQPRLNDVLRQVRSGAERQGEHCSVAGEALLALVSAHCSLVTPQGQQWFRFSHPVERGEKYERWYQHATEVAQAELARCRFYADIKKVVTDRCLFGTGAMFVEDAPGGRGVRVAWIPMGSFAFARDAAGGVGVFVREFRFTPVQAAERWGLGKLPGRVASAYENADERYTEKFVFWHVVRRRRGYAVGNVRKDVSAAAMRFESLYVLAEGDFPVLERGGYQEMPYMVTLFQEWEDEQTIWGYPPGLMCADEIHRAVKVDRVLDSLADLAVLPRVLADAEQVGDVDFRPGGQTVVDREVANLQLPREWLSQGRYDMGLERQAAIEGKIRSAFFLPFLQPISHLEPGVTATEVLARQEEQALSFSSVFSQYVHDLNVLLERVFAILFRQGAFDLPGVRMPDVYQVKAGDAESKVELPKVCFNGKIAQMIEKMQGVGLNQAVSDAAAYVQVCGDESVLDYVDLGQAVKHQFMMYGAPSAVFRTEEEVASIRERRAVAQVMQAANQQAQAAERLNGRGGR